MLANEYTEARIDLAAVLRWSARLGYQTGTCNHFSFMVPGRDDLFLVNPEGYFWSEVTASSLHPLRPRRRGAGGRRHRRADGLQPACADPPA